MLVSVPNISNILLLPLISLFDDSRRNHFNQCFESKQLSKIIKIFWNSYRETYFQAERYKDWLRSPIPVNHNGIGKTTLVLLKVLLCISRRSRIGSSFLVVSLVLVGFCNRLHLKKKKVSKMHLCMYEFI